MFFQTTGVPPGYGFCRACGCGYQRNCPLAESCPCRMAALAAASNPGGLSGMSMDMMSPKFKPMTRLQAREYFLPEM